MSKLKSCLIDIFKGFLIGIGALIPGLSGGTIAAITYVFEPLLEAVANVHRHFIKSIKFILPIALGGIIALIVAPPVIELFTRAFPIISKWIFSIITAISTYIFAKNNVKFNPNLSKIICFFVGAVLSYLLTLTISNTALSQNNYGFIFLFILGIPLSFALILPAVSFSYMLLFFGLYEPFIASVNDLNFAFLLPLSLGTFIGCLLFSKLLLLALSRFKQETYSTILGFSVCSLINILFK